MQLWTLSAPKKLPVQVFQGRQFSVSFVLSHQANTSSGNGNTASDFDAGSNGDLHPDLVADPRAYPFASGFAFGDLIVAGLCIS